MKILASQTDWEPQGPKIGPLEPLQDPILAYLGRLGPIWGKKKGSIWDQNGCIGGD